MNKCIFVGRLVRDPEMRYAEGSGTAIARYTLAIDRFPKKEGQPSADFISCIAFGKNAEFAEKHLIKGMKILVEGHIQTGSYTNKDGQKVYTTDCIVEKHEFVESRNSGSAPEVGSTSGKSDDGFMNIPAGIDEELPFN